MSGLARTLKLAGGGILSAVKRAPWTAWLLALLVVALVAAPWLFFTGGRRENLDPAAREAAVKEAKKTKLWKYCRKHGPKTGVVKYAADGINEGLSEDRIKAVCQMANRLRLENTQLKGRRSTVGCFKDGQRVAEVEIDWGKWKDQDANGAWACNAWKTDECGGACTASREGKTTDRKVIVYRDEDLKAEIGRFGVGDHARLDSTGENRVGDEVTSIYIPEGLKAWFFMDSNFGGQMLYLGPGHHKNIGEPFNDSISSLKVRNFKDQ